MVNETRAGRASAALNRSTRKTARRRTARGCGRCGMAESFGRCGGVDGRRLILPHRRKHGAQKDRVSDRPTKAAVRDTRASDQAHFVGPTPAAQWQKRTESDLDSA